MGWGSASGIFDEVYEAVCEVNNCGDLPDAGKVYILEALIGALTDRDWDTWDEVGDGHDAQLIEAFENIGIYREDDDD